MNLHTYSLEQIESRPLPGPSAVICIADTPDLLAQIQDSRNVVARLDLVFADTGESFAQVRAPNADDARRILEFVKANEFAVQHMVFQCQVGIGRSLAASAAVQKIFGGDPAGALARGTHNRKLYRELLKAANVAPAPEPLVSLVTRIKYAPDRMRAFLMSIQRQRYDNWEVIFVTDGPNPEAHRVVSDMDDARVRIIETPEARGRWGHPYRQLGIEAARGAYIGLGNDDNYYVPGYLEQMVNAIQQKDAELVMCAMLHSYWGWRVIEPGHDVGSWIATRELVARTPWNGDSYDYDTIYLGMLRKNAAGRVTTVDHPLFVHN